MTEYEDSASYFMTNMTQEEYEERMGKRPVVPYKFNRIKYDERENAPLNAILEILKKRIELAPVTDTHMEKVPDFSALEEVLENSTEKDLNEII